MGLLVLQTALLCSLGLFLSNKNGKHDKTDTRLQLELAFFPSSLVI